MGVQYISNSSGETTGVFIPIEVWNDLKDRFRGLEQEERDIPRWQMDAVRERLDRHADAPGDAQDFDSFMDGLENGEG